MKLTQIENARKILNIFFEIKREKRFPLNAVIIGNDGIDSYGTYCNSLRAIEFYGDISSFNDIRSNIPAYNFIIFMAYQY